MTLSLKDTCVKLNVESYKNKRSNTHALRKSVICTLQYNSENNRLYAITSTTPVDQPQVFMQWISGNYYPRQKVSESFLNSIKRKGHLWIYNLLDLRFSQRVAEDSPFL
jgi:hypothetical protein